jgi:hypothetical protein
MATGVLVVEVLQNRFVISYQINPAAGKALNKKEEVQGGRSPALKDWYCSVVQFSEVSIEVVAKTMSRQIFLRRKIVFVIRE